MLVVHALWSTHEQLCLWAEDAGLPPVGPSSRGRRPKHPRPRSHPFASTPERIRRSLGLSVDAGQAITMPLLLPSMRNGPQASPSLIRTDSGEIGEPDELAPWEVPGLAFAPSDGLDVLLATSGATGVPCIAGATLVHLGEVAKLALELLARGRVLPSLICAPEGGWVARWRSVPDSFEDAERLALLTHALPSLARAQAEENRAPATIVGEVLEALVDATARAALAPGALRRAGKRVSAASGVQEWLDALTVTGPDVVGGDQEKLVRLARELEDWAAHAPGQVASGPLRTCFRFSPPDAANGQADGVHDRDDGVHDNREDVLDLPSDNENQPWRVDFLLQATDDLSLIIPAERVWETTGQTVGYLERTLEHPQERLLSDLGRAAALFPKLESALRTATPTGLNLTVHEAHIFLRESAPLLEQSGFGVLLPAWARTGGARVGAKLRARASLTTGSNGSGLLGLDAICEYDWRLAIGDAELSPEELEQLASLKTPLVRVRGEWVELKQDELQAALAFFERYKVGAKPAEMTASEVLRVGMGLDRPDIGLPVVGIEADGWLHALLERVEDRSLKKVAQPAELQGTLRPYQRRGLGWLRYLGELGLGGCLADDMGLGKTVQLLALVLAEREGYLGPEEPVDSQPPTLPPTLLICPTSLLGNWEREAERFAPSLRVHVHYGTERLEGEEFARVASEHDLVLTSYALAGRDTETLRAATWGRIVLDEAQNIKNPSAAQTRAIRSLRAPQRVAMTGTPVENRLSELWSIMDFLNPGLLGSQTAFRSKFAIPIERYRDDEAATLLGQLTQPFVLRRLKTDRRIIRDLPKKIEMKIACTLTREQASLYKAVVDEMLERVEAADEGIERKGLVLATMLKLKQVCNHPAQLLGDGSMLDGRSGKLARLEEILEEALAEGDRALIFTQFAQFGHALQAHLQERLGQEVLYLHGGTAKTARDGLVERFQSQNGPPLFLLSLKAGGTGLNLTAANHVIHFDRWWNPAVEDQATDRAYRIGQRKAVQVRKLVCAGTLEERIDVMIERKRDLAERIVGSGEGWLTELSTSELRELVTLSTETLAAVA